VTGEPVRDLVRFPLTYALYLDRHTRAGRQVAGHRGLWAGVWGSGITFAVNGDGWFPDLVRDFVGGGLKRLGADAGSWRLAMLAGLAEVAATADHLDFAERHWRLFERLTERRPPPDANHLQRRRASTARTAITTSAAAAPSPRSAVARGDPATTEGA